MITQTDTVLVVDNDPALLLALKRTIEVAAYHVLTAPDAGSARQFCREHQISVMLLDIGLVDRTDDASGFEVLEWVRHEHPALSVVMITADPKIERVVRAIKMGAYDFLEKPIDRDRLLVTLRNALDRGRLEAERTGLLQSLQAQHEMIGDSLPMRKLRSSIAQVAPTDEKVLIVGESGTGKELVALAIYSRSRRASKPLVTVNCAAIPKDLIESELFGHVKGAFTGATADKPGKFKLADGGTIFLDEIGDMSPDVQAKVLRALQEGEIEPVGGHGTEKVDVRLIAATNRDLNQMTSAGTFRQDLYYRLKSVVLRVPPLRERMEDIPALMGCFLERAANRNNRPLLRLEDSALNRLLSHRWPGNVREMENLASPLSVYTSGPEITIADLNPLLGEDLNSEISGQRPDYHRDKENWERDYFRRLMIIVKGNISELARLLNLDRAGLHRKLKALGIVE